jgi:hypothetical protein
MDRQPNPPLLQGRRLPHGTYIAHYNDPLAVGNRQNRRNVSWSACSEASIMLCARTVGEDMSLARLDRLGHNAFAKDEPMCIILSGERSH